ncbi:phage baseplate assembly protein V [Muricoccus radiodurans]|uniref:phage baseplate assembly protein V n=1 Tax=Muricoccus radiodurans TaxID=2231721 RepID=UPI003CEE2505
MGSFNGLYRASVVNNADPLSQGRVQVSVPSVSGGGGQWALPCRPPQAGRQPPTPQIGAAAWVMFEGGDPSRPVWMGVMA